MISAISRNKTRPHTTPRTRLWKINMKVNPEKFQALLLQEYNKNKQSHKLQKNTTVNETKDSV